MATQFPNILEKTTRWYSATITDQDGVGIPAAQLTTLTLTLYSLHGAKAVINSRSEQNILNANNVVVDSSGVLTWELLPADNTILDTTLPVEVHRAKFEFTWNSGSRNGKHEIDLHVTNLHKVT